MRRAKNINEFANNVNPEEVLTVKEKDFYIPIYEDKLKVLRSMVINDQLEAQTFFVAGQTGTGKTTALNFFKTQSLEEKFHVKYINMRDYLDLNDVDIIDFLLAFAFALVKENDSMADKYYQDLMTLQKRHEEELIEISDDISEKKSSIGAESEASIGGGFLNFLKLKAGFFTNLRQDNTYRKTTRKVFKLKIPFLSQLVNEVIDSYIEIETKGKKLLVIIDDLDKLKSIEQIQAVFIENRSYIFGMKCKKIISIPTHLAKTPEIFNYSQYPICQFSLRLTPNPFTKDKQGEDTKEEDNKIQRNRQLLKNAIIKRIEEGLILIDDNALDIAIDYSGGIIRQLIRIIYVAAVQVRALEGEKISGNDVKTAVDNLRNMLAGTITSSDKIFMLNTILEKNVPTSEQSLLFIEALHASNILAYENGDPWYEVNPIIRDTVKTYAARLNG